MDRFIQWVERTDLIGVGFDALLALLGAVMAIVALQSIFGPVV